LSLPAPPRRLAPADAFAFQALRLEAFRTHDREFHSTEADEAAVSLAEHEARLARDFVAGVFDADQLMGAAGLTRFSRAKLRHKAELWGMYVRPAFRSRGAADALLGALLGHAQGLVERVTLVVTSDNLPAVRLYTRWGFEPYGREPRSLMLADGSYVDETLMMKRL